MTREWLTMSNAAAVKKGEDWELDSGFSRMSVAGDSACQSFEEQVWITAWLGRFRREWTRGLPLRLGTRRERGRGGANPGGAGR